MIHQKTWHGGVHTCFIPQWSCYHDPVPWVVMMVVICYPVASTDWDVYLCTKHTQSCWPFCQWRHPCPLHITWNLHPSSVQAPVDIHRRSHSFTLIHPREVFLAWCRVITRPKSSCGIVLLSLPPGVGLVRVGLVHLSHTWKTPTHKGLPASDAMRRSWLQCRMHECLC